MSKRFVGITLVLVLVLSGYTVWKIASPPVADQDAARLARLGEQAFELAQRDMPDAVLRQVDTDQQRVIFHFTGQNATGVTQLEVPHLDAPVDEWIVQTDLISPLMWSTGTGLDLRELKVGPGRVAKAITAHWVGCTIRGIALYEQNGEMIWTAFCTTPEGVVSGEMRNDSGVFEPSAAPPARLAPTALPQP